MVYYTHMASYRGHLAFGGAVAASGAAGIAAYAVAKDFQTLAVVFVLTLFGAVLPDVDSDSSVPFYVVFGPMSLAFASGVIYETLLSTKDIYLRIAVPIIAFALFWFLIGGIIKRLTHHRGIFHSLPMLAVAALGTVLLAKHYALSDFQAVLFGAAIGAGFFSHLLLDELYALTHRGRHRLGPNKAFGTALKFWAPSTFASITTYIVAIMFFVLTSPVINAALTGFTNLTR